MDPDEEFGRHIAGKLIAKYFLMTALVVTGMTVDTCLRKPAVAASVVMTDQEIRQGKCGPYASEMMELHEAQRLVNELGGTTGALKQFGQRHDPVAPVPVRPEANGSKYADAARKACGERLKAPSA